MTTTKHRQPTSRAHLLAAITVIIVITYWYIYPKYHLDLQEARKRISTDSKLVETPCGIIEYAVAGPENGPPLLVVHGAGGGFDQGLLIGEPLVKRGFRIITPSRFGFLRTPLPSKEVSVSAQADAHACLLDALQIKKAGIFGSSAGAPSSLKFAQKYPDRCTALVLLVPGGGGHRDPETNKPLMKIPLGQIPLAMMGVFKFDFLYWAAITFARPIMIRTTFGTPVRVYSAANSYEKEHLDSFLPQMLPVSLRAAGMNTEHLLISERIDHLEEIKTPTLTLSHIDDLYGTYEIARTIADRIPGAVFVGYPSGGHMSVGYQDNVNSEVANFFSEHKYDFSSEEFWDDMVQAI